MSLGRVIRERRKELGMSQKQLAEKLLKEDGEPISPQYLNDIELERRAAPEYILDQLSRILRLPRDHLYLLAGQFPPDVRPKTYDAPRFQRAFQAFRKAWKKRDG
ncbi:MAG: helix-turn-helix transcriptional regulator [Dehalococcoidia bacterium]|nr:helix-turn-helix transcriptional regulator [Dehalococcoidia bacterium]